MALVAVTRDDLDSAGLRAAAVGTSDAKQARRLLTLALVLDGHPRLFAAQAGGMDRQTAYSGDCDRLIRPMVITHSGDRDHLRPVALCVAAGRRAAVGRYD